MTEALPNPCVFLGEDVGTDYFLAGYDRLSEYWKTLDAASPKVRVLDVGLTSEGRPHLALAVSSASNIANLEQHLQIAREIAYPAEPLEEHLPEKYADACAVIYLGGGVHTSEVIPAEALFELAWRLTAGEDTGIDALLERTIVILGHGNPDGHQYAAQQYMREPDPTRRAPEMRSILARMVPRYSGADNNRDGLCTRLPETRNVNNLLYRIACPQLAYDAHQTGPLGVAMYFPPYKEPMALGLDPVVATMVNELGLSLHSRFMLEGRRGTYYGVSAEYQQWIMCGMISSAHNILSFHSEVIGTPHPQRMPLVLDRQLPQMSLPQPLEPGIWHAAQSMDYQLAAHIGIIEWVRDNRLRILRTVWKANVDAIEAGRRDSWTINDARIAALTQAAASNPAPAPDAFDRAAGVTTGNLRGGISVDPALHARVLRDPAARDARAYLIPREQQAATAVSDFCEAMESNGVVLRRTHEAVEIDGVIVPAGSWLITTDQSCRGVILQAFEPTFYPEALARSEGDGAALYGAGGTPALLMGFDFHRLLDAELPASEVHSGSYEPLPASPGGMAGKGILLQRSNERIFAHVNKALTEGLAAMAVQSPEPAGAFWFPDLPESLVAAAAADGIVVVRGRTPDVGLTTLKAPRIAIQDMFGGLANAGWIRLALDTMCFSHRDIFVAELDKDEWMSQTDVLIIPDGRAPTGYHEPALGQRYIEPDLAEVYPEDRPLWGPITGHTIEQIRRFVEAGGRLVTLGAGGDLLPELLPEVGDPLPARMRELGLVPEHVMLRKSIFAARLVADHPLTAGCKRDVAVVSSGRSYKIAAPVEAIVHYAPGNPLLSGLAIAGEILAGQCLAFRAPIGNGDIVAFGFDAVHRGQAASTLALFANALLIPRD